jgi:hypothetical protein
MIASQVNGGTMDIHTYPGYVVTTTVAATPSRPLTETLRGNPYPGQPTRLDDSIRTPSVWETDFMNDHHPRAVAVATAFLVLS